jgi:hypothetical protein
MLWEWQWPFKLGGRSIGIYNIKKVLQGKLKIIRKGWNHMSLLLGGKYPKGE